MRRLPSAAVNQVGKLLEGKEADTEGKQNIPGLEIGPKDRVDVLHEKIVILENAQCPDVDRAADDEQKFSHLRRILSGKEEADPEIEKTASQHDPEKADVIPGIKPQGHPDEISLCQFEPLHPV